MHRPTLLRVSLKSFLAAALGAASPSLAAAQPMGAPHSDLHIGSTQFPGKLSAPHPDRGDGRHPLLVAQRGGGGSLAETMRKAATSFGQSDYTAAIALWTQVITSSPGIGLLNEALINRAKAYLIVGQPLLALSDLDATRYQPNETKALADLWLLKGSALLQNKQYPEAIAAFGNAEKLQPPNPMLLANRSVAYQSLGNMAAARADLLAAIRLQPNLSNYFNLAVMERLSGNYASCQKLLSEIIAKSQPFSKLFVQRGLCAAQMNQHDAAIADMLKALKLEENNVEAIQQIGMSLAAKNQKEPAKQYLLKASSLRLASGQIEEYKKLMAIISSLEKR